MKSTGKPSEILTRLNKMAGYDPDEEIGLYICLYCRSHFGWFACLIFLLEALKKCKKTNCVFCVFSGKCDELAKRNYTLSEFISIH